MIDIEVPFVMSVVGPRGKGKSYFGKQLLEYFIKNNTFDKYVILSPSVHLNHDYDDFMTLKGVDKTLLKKKKRFLKESVHVFDTFTADDVSALMDAQYKCKRGVNNKERIKNHLAENHIRDGVYFDSFELRNLMNDKDPNKLCPQTLLIMDDCIDSEILKPGGPVDVIAARGRHFNLSMMFMTQKLRSVSNLLRENAEYMIFFRTNLYTELEKIFEENISRDDRKAMRLSLKKVFQTKYNFVFINRHEGDPHKMLTYGTTQDFFGGGMQSLYKLGDFNENLIINEAA